MYDMQKHHEMKLEKSQTSAEEEWSCPACGRRIALHSPPAYEKLTLERGDKYILAWGSSIGPTVCVKTVLEKGDENALHYGSKTMPTIEVPEATLSNMSSGEEETAISPIGQLPVWDDLRSNEEDGSVLSDEWRAWLEEAGFEDWWNQDLKSPE